MLDGGEGARRYPLEYRFSTRSSDRFAAPALVVSCAVALGGCGNASSISTARADHGNGDRDASTVSHDASLVVPDAAPRDATTEDRKSPSGAFCDFKDSGAPRSRVAVLAFEHGLSWVRADGSIEAAYAFEVSPVDASALWSRGTVLTQSGNYIAATTRLDVRTGAQKGQWSEFVLLETTGAIVLHRTGTGFLGSGGIVAMLDRLIWPDGREELMLDATPIAPPSAEGWVPVLVQRDGSTSFGFREPGSGNIKPLRYPRFDAGKSPIAIGSAIVYVGVDRANPVFVMQDAAAAQTIQLPASLTPDITAVIGDRYVLFRESALALWIVDVAFGTLVRREASLPSTQRPFTSTLSETELQLGDDGALLLLQRDDYQGGLFRSGDGQTWERIGSSVAGVNAVSFGSRSGSYWVEASQESAFLPDPKSMEVWSPAPAGSEPALGESAQIVRPSTRVAWSMPVKFPDGGWQGASADGRCATYWAPTMNGNELKVLSLTSGSQYLLVSLIPPSYHMDSAVLWIE